jgi:hypothetical protein
MFEIGVYFFSPFCGRFIEHKTKSKYDNVLRLSTIWQKSPIWGHFWEFFFVKFDQKQGNKHGDVYFSGSPEEADLSASKANSLQNLQIIPKLLGLTPGPYGVSLL